MEADKVGTYQESRTDDPSTYKKLCLLDAEGTI